MGNPFDAFKKSFEGATGVKGIERGIRNLQGEEEETEEEKQKRLREEALKRLRDGK